jgi:tetratricopeptide (TPR) repeat protein
MSLLGSLNAFRARLNDCLSPLPLAVVLFLFALVYANRDLIPFGTGEFDYQRLLKQHAAISDRLDSFRMEYMTLVNANQAGDAAALLRQLETDIEATEGAFREFVSAHPDHVRAVTTYGNFLEEIGKADEACRWWSKAVLLNGKDPNLLNNLANYYGHNGEAGRAIRLYEEAIQLNPTEAVYHFNLGNMYYLFRRETEQIHGWDVDQIFREALDQFRVARDLDPNNFEYASAYAETFYGVNFLKQRIAWDEALKAWEFCLNMKLNSGQKDYVKVHLVRLNLYTGNPMEAARSASEIQSQELRRVAKNLLNKMFGPPLKSPYSA